MSEIQYEELQNLISFEGFDFAKYYEHETTLLRPRLENMGFRGVSFEMGEYDSFGPLTRVVTAYDKDGKFRRFIYG